MSEHFDTRLKSNETLFTNETALDYEYLPPIIKYRENQQHHIATCIQPLLQKKTGRNLVILGAPGIGKTAAIRAILRELENETQDVSCIYLNCWKKDSSFKLVCDICEQLGYTWTHNKRLDQLTKIVAQLINKKAAVLVFDEIDKLEDNGLLYSLLEDVYRKTIILITNDQAFLANLDQRVRSRLTPEILEFKPYKLEEVHGILNQRIEYALAKNILSEELLTIISKTTHEAADIRTGLYLLRETTLNAEASGSKKIIQHHIDLALTKLRDFKAKAVAMLDEEERTILTLLSENSGALTKDVFVLYQHQGGKRSYRTFQRKIKDLIEGKYITFQEIYHGEKGRMRKLDYFSDD